MSRSKTAVRTCPQCWKPIQSRQLARHLRAHACERPFVCPMCRRHFAAFENIHRHLMRFCGQESEAETMQASVVLNPGRPSANLNNQTGAIRLEAVCGRAVVGAGKRKSIAPRRFGVEGKLRARSGRNVKSAVNSASRVGKSQSSDLHRTEIIVQHRPRFLFLNDRRDIKPDSKVLRRRSQAENIVASSQEFSLQYAKKSSEEKVVVGASSSKLKVTDIQCQVRTKLSNFGENTQSYYQTNPSSEKPKHMSSSTSKKSSWNTRSTAACHLSQSKAMKISTPSGIVPRFGKVTWNNRTSLTSLRASSSAQRSDEDGSQEQPSAWVFGGKSVRQPTFRSISSSTEKDNRAPSLRSTML